MAATRREALAYLGAAVTGLAAAALVQAEEGPRTVRITAKKFEFAPREIALKRGEAVVLELESLDREHGFDCPGLGLRADVGPGRIARLPLRPPQVGRFSFICNVFCGEGHDEMDGVFVVTD